MKKIFIGTFLVFSNPAFGVEFVDLNIQQKQEVKNFYFTAIHFKKQGELDLCAMNLFELKKIVSEYRKSEKLTNDCPMGKMAMDLDSELDNLIAKEQN